VPSFPERFLRGATTGSHQTEGNNVASDWRAQGTRPARPSPSRLAMRRTATTADDEARIAVITQALAAGTAKPR